MIEVFKTNIQTPDQAAMVIARIHQTFSEYTATFDLNDCDKVLRVQCATGLIPAVLIHLLNDLGFDAEVLPENEPDNNQMQFRIFDSSIVLLCYQAWMQEKRPFEDCFI